LTICGVLVGSGLMLMFLVNSAWQFYLFYVALVGVGMGSLVAPQMSTIARWFVKKRNMMTAILMAGGGLGGLIGPPLISWIIYTHSWREAYLFVGGGVFILMMLLGQFLKRNPNDMGLVPYGEESKKEERAPVYASELSPKQVFKTRKFWFFALTMFCVGFCLWTVLVYIVPYAIDQGIPPGVAAIILSAMNGAQLVGSIALGYAADRIGNGKSLISCVCLLSAVILLILPVSNPWVIGFIVMIIAFGLGGVSVVQSSMTAELFGMKSHGIILGYTVFTFSLGGAVGSYIGGALLDSTGSYRLVFLLCGILILDAIIMAIYLIRKRKEEVLEYFKIV
jgi:MFS family permease